MGLQLVLGSMKTKAGSANDTNMDIVNDAFNSCQTAIEILNDILTYDKLEAGDMHLNCSTVELEDFIYRCAQPFILQVIYSYAHFMIIHSNFINYRPSIWVYCLISRGHNTFQYA